MRKMKFQVVVRACVRACLRVCVYVCVCVCVMTHHLIFFFVHEQKRTRMGLSHPSSYGPFLSLLLFLLFLATFLPLFPPFASFLGRFGWRHGINLERVTI